MSGSLGESLERRYGKYRGKVLDNFDPLFLGRILAEVPAVPNSVLNWALPAAPYAGMLVGFFAVPEIGANVWIEYEGGDPNYPIWSGCFWEEGQMPFDPAIPLTKIFKTECISIMLNDEPEIGGLIIAVTPPAVNVPLTMTFTSEGITLICPESVITMTPELIEMTTPPAGITISPEVIEVEIPPSTVTLSEEGMVVTSDAIEVTATDVNITAAVEVEGNVEIAGAVEVEGNVEIAGAVEIEGNVEIAGAVEIEGNVEIAGAVEVEGDVALVGAMEIVGDLALVGAGEVAGNFAVAGVIEGVVVPPL
ncbi:MAG TPA: phage baseplate assembly protein V [Longimicrobiaceae bacterium]|nr:phage baseplate assembly protein V [Longimicrobiaceae bacterium]